MLNVCPVPADVESALADVEIFRTTWAIRGDHG